MTPHPHTTRTSTLRTAAAAAAVAATMPAVQHTTHPALAVGHRVSELAADPEVADLTVALGVEQQVGGLDVAVHHPQALVQVKESGHNLRTWQWLSC